jgi:hypothetical protein
MKMMKLLCVCACSLALGLTFCAKKSEDNTIVAPPTTVVYDYSDTVALRALLNANGLTTISAGTPVGNPPTIVMTLQDGNMHRITELTLNSKNITVISSHIKELTALRILRIDSNSIASLPPELGQCTSLVWVEITNNLLTTLPAEISALHRLQTLKLSFNRISSLPSTFWTLTTLGVVQLDHNQLDGISTDVSNLTNLAKLTLSDNKLTALPASVRSDTLQMLEINNNHICPGTLNASFAAWLDMVAEFDWRKTQGTCP